MSMKEIRNEIIKYAITLGGKTKRQDKTENEIIDDEIREWFEENRELNKIAERIFNLEQLQQSLSQIEKNLFTKFELPFYNDFTLSNLIDYIDVLDEDLTFEYGQLVIDYQLFEFLPDISELSMGYWQIEHMLIWRTSEDIHVHIRIILIFKIDSIDDEGNRHVSVSELQIISKGAKEEKSMTIKTDRPDDHLRILIQKGAHNEWGLILAHRDNIDGLLIDVNLATQLITAGLSVDVILYRDTFKQAQDLQIDEILFYNSDEVSLNKQHDVEKRMITEFTYNNRAEMSINKLSITTNLPSRNENILLRLVLKDIRVAYVIPKTTVETLINDALDSGKAEFDVHVDMMRIDELYHYLALIKKEWIEEALEMSEDVGHYLSRMTFSNTARIDELFATVPRYVEQEIEIDSLVTGQAFEQIPLIPIAGSRTLTSRYITNGFNESERTVDSETANNPVPYPMSLTYVAHPPLDTVVVGRFEVYSEGSLKILVEGQISHFPAAEPNVDINRVNFSYSTTMAYYEPDLFALKVGLMSGTSHRGYIPIPMANARYFQSIQRLYILDNRGLDAPLIDSVQGDISIYSTNMSDATSDVMKRTLTGGDSTVMIIDGIRYSGMVFNLDVTFDKKLFSTNEEYIYYHYSSHSAWAINRSTRTITSNQNLTATETTAISDLDENWRIANGMNVNIKSVFRIDQYHNVLQTRLTRMQSLDTTITTNTQRRSKATGLFVRAARFNSMQVAAVHNGTTYRWSQFMPVQPIGRVHGVNPLHILGAFILTIDDLKLKYRIQMAPEGAGIVKIYDSSVRDIQLVLESMELEIQRLSDELLDIAQRLEYVEAQIKSMIGSDDIWQNIISTIGSLLLDISLSVAMGGVGYAMSTIVKSGVGAMKVAMSTLSKSKTVFSSLKRQLAKGSSTPIEAINKHLFSHVGVREAKYSSTSWQRIPKHLDAETNLRLNENFRYSMLLPEFSMGTRNAMYTRRRNDARPLINVPDDYAGPISKLGIHYQPLKVGGLSGLASRFFEKIKFDKLDAQYMFRANKVRARKPAHAWGSLDTYEQDSLGNSIRTLSVFGVGEHGGMNANSMSGKIDGIIFKERINRRTHDGRTISVLLSHTESGYSDADVRALFEKRFKLPSSHLEVSECWMLLHKKVSSSVVNSNKAHEYTFASPYMHKVIEDIIKNPSNLPYNLWQRNCQHLVNDINRYIKGYPISDAWGLQMNRRMDSVIFRAMGQTLDAIDATSRFYYNRIHLPIIKYVSNLLHGSRLDNL